MVIYGRTRWFWAGSIPAWLNTYRYTLDENDSDYRAKIGILRMRPTGWKIGNSNQNGCENIHVDGAIYRLVDSTYVPDPQFLDGGYTVWKDLYFNRLSYIDDEFTFIDLGTMDDWTGYRRHYACCLINILVDDCVCFLNEDFSWLEDDAGQVVPGWSKEDHIETSPWGTDWFPRTGPYGVPCMRSFNIDTGGVSVTLDFGSFSGVIHRKPTAEELHSSDLYEYIRVHEQSGWTNAESEIVFPPDNIGTYDIRFGDISYELDAAMADALSDQVDFTTSNGIAYALDAKDIISSAKSDFNLARSLAKGAPGKLKIASKLFLSIHYGWKLMAADTLEFSSALTEFSKNSNRRVHFSVQGVTKYPERGGITLESAIAHRSIYYDPYAQLASETHKLAEAMDVVPDLSNVWDMIPFSFVVDWFTNVGELAEGVDALMTLVQQHKVLGTITSYKEIYKYRVKGGIGEYTYRYYNRDCVPDWYPLPEFSFQIKNPLTNLTHWCEAGALVVATRP